MKRNSFMYLKWPAALLLILILSLSAGAASNEEYIVGAEDVLEVSVCAEAIDRSEGCTPDAVTRCIVVVRGDLVALRETSSATEQRKPFIRRRFDHVQI